MFDSPFDLCPRCQEMVLLDQTLAECAREHGCLDLAHCPLRKCFASSGLPGSDGETQQLPKDRNDSEH